MSKTQKTSKSKNTKSMSQKERVRAVLTRKTRNTLTAAQAARDLGVMNLRARISELRNSDGMNIRTEARKNRDGSVETVYTL